MHNNMHLNLNDAFAAYAQCSVSSRVCRVSLVVSGVSMHVSIVRFIYIFSKGNVNEAINSLLLLNLML